GRQEALAVVASPAHPSREQGSRGEQAAAELLAALGFRVLARDLRTRLAELDLVARRGPLLIAVEVKTRADHVAPERLVAAKRLLRLGAGLGGSAPGLAPAAGRLRVDVIAVRWPAGAARPELVHFTGAAAPLR